MPEGQEGRMSRPAQPLQVAERGIRTVACASRKMIRNSITAGGRATTTSRRIILRPGMCLFILGCTSVPCKEIPLTFRQTLE